MREIKLRAWDESRGKFHSSAKWVEFRFINGVVKAFNFNRQGAEVELPVYQFTGLQDKNGVEIYEGDVIKCRYSFSINPVFNAKLSRFIGVATFTILKSCVSIDGVKQYENKQGALHKAICIEVIGNIYENPELI